MNRRDFLKTSFLSLLLGAGGPGFLSRTALAAMNKGKTLVVVQLTGGNDALNTLVPYRNGAYYAARPTLGVRRADVLPLDVEVGLHPGLRPWMKLWNQGELALIQGVGYPNPNRSHFASMAVWQSADPTLKEAEGWVGRISDKYGDPFCATNFGHVTPLALRGSHVILPSIQSVDSFQIKLPDSISSALTDILSVTANDRSEYLRASTVQMLTDTELVQRNIAKYHSGTIYPQSAFASSMRDVARMIAANIGPRVYYTSLAGFDTHVDQAREHTALLGELASTLVAFRADLEMQGLADDVLVIGFSEFGRRLAENASVGTDHGKAGMMFAVGKGVKGGLYGDQPDLEKLDDGDPRFTTDFRSVYASALDHWLHIDSQDILGGKYQALDFLN